VAHRPAQHGRTMASRRQDAGRACRGSRSRRQGHAAREGAPSAGNLRSAPGRRAGLADAQSVFGGERAEHAARTQPTWNPSRLPRTSPSGLFERISPRRTAVERRRRARASAAPRRRRRGVASASGPRRFSPQADVENGQALRRGSGARLQLLVAATTVSPRRSTAKLQRAMDEDVAAVGLVALRVNSETAHGVGAVITSLVTRVSANRRRCAAARMSSSTSHRRAVDPDRYRGRGRRLTSFQSATHGWPARRASGSCGLSA
jgi:hypothetical protein